MNEAHVAHNTIFYTWETISSKNSYYNNITRIIYNNKNNPFWIDTIRNNDWFLFIMTFSSLNKKKLTQPIII